MSDLDTTIALKYRSMNGKGSIIEDFVGASDRANIMSKRVFDLLVNAGYTGLEAYDVSLLSENEWLDTHVLVRANNLCDLDEDGRVDPDSMSHPFSTPKGMGVIVCTENAKSFLEELSPKVTGPEFREYKMLNPVGLNRT